MAPPLKVLSSFHLINSLNLIILFATTAHKRITKKILTMSIKRNKPLHTKASIKIYLAQFRTRRFGTWLFSLVFFLHASKITLQDPRDRKTVGRWESAQNLNSRCLTVTDHGIRAMPPRRVLLNELKITGPRLFLGQSSAR